MATIDILTQNQVSGRLGPLDGVAPTKINEIITQVNTNTAALAGATNPFNFAGTIALPADFPAAPDIGDVFICTADVIDSDPTKTNTGDNFLAGDKIVWDGTAYQDGDTVETGIAVMTTTPYAVPDGIHTVLVDTVAIGGPSVVTMPEALPKRKGRELLVKDYTGAALTNPVACTPQGADEIDNIAGAKNITVNDGALEFAYVATGKIITDPSSADLAAHAALTDSFHGLLVSDPVTIDLKAAGPNPVTIPGPAGEYFQPMFATLRVSADGGLNGDATFTMGTAPAGTDILPLTPIVLAGAHTGETVWLAGGLPAIASDATVDVTVTAADTGVSGTAEVRFVGVRSAN